MKIVNANTGAGIPFASVTVYDINGHQIAGMSADSDGNVSQLNLGLYAISGNYLRASSVGYTARDIQVLDIIENAPIGLTPFIELPDVVITAVRKAKENPMAVILLVLIVLAFIFRKKLFK